MSAHTNNWSMSTQTVSVLQCQTLYQYIIMIVFTQSLWFTVIEQMKIDVTIHWLLVFKD